MEKKVFLLMLIILLGVTLFLVNTDNPEEAGETEDTQELSFEEKQWNSVFEKAFEEIDCPEPRDPSSLPDGYYKGPMIDTHIHMQSLPENPSILPDIYESENVGVKSSIDEWRCMLEVEGTKQAFVFYPVWNPIIEKHIEFVEKAEEKYLGKFIPFIMPPDNDGSPDGYPTVNAEELESMLNISPGLFRGYGEIGLYARQGGAPALPPDSERLKEIYPIVRKNNLMVYFHLEQDQKESLMRAAAANPDIIFIFHGDQLIDCEECDGTHSKIEEILENNPNVYYGVDEIYGGEWLVRPGVTKEEFISHFEDYEPLIRHDLERFKEFIEEHPDQVLWGTDRGWSGDWDKDPDVALTLNDYTRFFIGKLDPAVQEKIAYKNAEKILNS